MSNKLCSVMQPTFLPWVGYFDLIDNSDDFIFYDDVQFTKQSWQSRNQIKTANGVIWLTVPLKKHELSSKINQIEINNAKPWVPKLLKTLFFTYQKTKHFKEAYTFFDDLFNAKEYLMLSDLSISIIEALIIRLGMCTQLHRSSNMKDLGDDRELRLINICKSLECDNYLSAKGSALYIEANRPSGIFPDYDIELYYQNFNHPEYSQIHGDFEAYMSIVDLIFNEGFEKSLEIIRSGRGKHLRSGQFDL
ncbi:conserved hypothetical protein [Oleispira antarctica RB-8]|uniref:WbqC-like family protein n=1 Tax=Oleispira antarctica RB-8 TaxID=698738 RepID=R4YT93_OLEAN|nr:conserved hypothetical protein [Oleispira antarctica RB-8]